jgi:hypothetical protein
MPAFGNIQHALAKEMDDGPSEQESKTFGMTEVYKY